MDFHRYVLLWISLGLTTVIMFVFVVTGLMISSPCGIFTMLKRVPPISMASMASGSVRLLQALSI